MVSESVAQGASLPRGVGACIHTLPESVVSLIPWRPRCSEEAAVPLSGQTAVKEALFQRGEVCCSRQLGSTWYNRLAISVQTHFFDSGSAAAVGRQERWTQRIFVWLAKGGRKVEDFRATVARGERASCAEKRTGEATYAGESARTCWSCRGGARPPNLQTRR